MINESEEILGTVDENDENFVLPLSEQTERKTNQSDKDNSNETSDDGEIIDVLPEADDVQEEEPEVKEKKEIVKKFDEERYAERIRKKNEAIEAERRAKESLIQENMRLRELAEQAQQIATLNASDAIDAKINDLMQKQIVALEESDHAAHAKCSFELNQLANQKSEIERMKAQYKVRQEQLQQQQQYQQPYQQGNPQSQQQQFQQQPYQQQQFNQEDADDSFEPVNENLVNWIHKTPWANPNKKEFNQRMVNDVDAYSVILNNKLIDSGKEHLIGTANYFKTIDKYVENRYFKNKSPSLNKSSHNVAPVKASSGSEPVQRYSLTQDQRKMARAFNMTDKEYYTELQNMKKGENNYE